MATSDFQRNYNFTDSELCTFTADLCSVMTRDILLLTPYGITALKISDLEDLKSDFEALHSDDYYVGKIMTATQNKVAKLDIVKEIIRNMSMRVIMKWGENSGQYRSLGITGMNKFTEDKLLNIARDIHTDLTEMLTDLASVGLIQSMLDDFDTAITDLQTARKAQKDAVNLRDTQTENRITKGNELYALVSLYCELGKRVFAVSSPARYNDYIIYSGSAPTPLPAPTGIIFILSNMTLRWDNITGATSYIAQISTDGGVNFEEVYTGSENHFIYEPTVDGTVTARIIGNNENGHGPASTYTFSYFNELPAPSDVAISLISGSSSMFQLTFSPVLSATVYKIYKSVVEIGASAGEYSFVTDVSGTEYSGNAETGMRSYFILKSANDIQTSVWSESVFIDA